MSKLVLTVKPGERVQLAYGGVDGWVSLEAIYPGKPGQVRLSFEFPRDVKVLREKLVERSDLRSWRESLPDMITTPDPHPAARQAAR